MGRLNLSPRSNWVEKRGGLPDYIDRIAVHLVEQGFTRQRAIATAVSTVKRWCATGYHHQWKKSLSGAARAKACAAAAQWAALKASA
jgi:hypothetical protein